MSQKYISGIFQSVIVGLLVVVIVGGFNFVTDYKINKVKDQNVKKNFTTQLSNIERRLKFSESSFKIRIDSIHSKFNVMVRGFNLLTDKVDGFEKKINGLTYVIISNDKEIKRRLDEYNSINKKMYYGATYSYRKNLKNKNYVEVSEIK